jgi:histidine ammonia-lyase
MCIGVLEDALPWLRQLIENELNSANDNPLIDPDDRARAAWRPFLRRPHRDGDGHAEVPGGQPGRPARPPDWRCWWMRATTTACRPTCRAPAAARRPINHGLKALQISVSAWTAEALKQTMPASVFSRSTECHNQDKVSMGTIAARDCLRVLELTEQVAAAMLIAARQAMALRRARGRALNADPDALASWLGCSCPSASPWSTKTARWIVDCTPC